MRPVLATAILSTLSACGDATPRFRQRSAPEWVEQLWSAETSEVETAIDALVRLADSSTSAVSAALEARMRRPPPPAAGAPFTVLVDLDAAESLGLAVPSVGDTAVLLRPTLLARIDALGFAPVSVRATKPGEIDVVASRPHPRADMLRLQAALCTRAALDLRVVVPDPAAPRPAASLRAPVYDDPMPFAERVESETQRFRDARARGTAYAPASPRWRLVPQVEGPGTTADALVLVEEPMPTEGAVDERSVAKAVGAVEAGNVVVAAAFTPERAAEANRFFRRNTGLELATILDGRVVARSPMPPTDGASVRVPLGRAPAGADASAWAKDMAVILPLGRMPLPLKAVPISERYGTDPPPDNPFSRLLALLGRKVAPLTDRIAAGDFPSWAKTSAAWAREHAMD